MKTEKFEMIAKTFQGLEDVLAEEITKLGGDNIEIGRRMVSFNGDLELLYKANLCCHTALRILKPIYTFTAACPDEVYEKIKQFDWDKYLTIGKTFAIDSVVFSEEFRHSKFVTYRAKDAIVDYFNEKYGERPSVRINNADLMLNLHIAHHTCTLSLDSSGESLHKRGYRIDQTEAPLNEVLAAGMILKTGWKGQIGLLDPMCGSGTLLIEAALIALNIAPGIFRKDFAFEKWNDYDEELFDRVYNDDSNEKPLEVKLFGSDISPKAISIAEENIKSAGLSKYISLKVIPFQKYETAPENCMLITNPPYGERLSSKDLLGLYEVIGERLKHVFKGYDAWIISYREECFDKIGLKPAAKFDLMNGALECEFRKYEIFDGKYKDFKRESGGFRAKQEETTPASFPKRSYNSVQEEDEVTFSYDPEEENMQLTDDEKPEEKSLVENEFDNENSPKPEQYSKPDYNSEDMEDSDQYNKPRFKRDDRQGSDRYSKPGFKRDDRQGGDRFGKPGFKRDDRQGGDRFSKPGFKRDDRQGGDRFSKPGFNRDDRQGGDRFGKPGFNRDDRQGGDRFSKPGFNRDDRQGGDRFGKPSFNRDDRQGGDRFSKPGFNRDDRQGGDRFGKPSFNRDDRQGGDRFGKPSFNRDDRQGGDRFSKPGFNRDDRQGGDRFGKPGFKRDDRQGGDRFGKPSFNRDDRQGGDRFSKPGFNRDDRQGGDRFSKPGFNRDDRQGGDRFGKPDFKKREFQGEKKEWGERGSYSDKSGSFEKRGRGNDGDREKRPSYGSPREETPRWKKIQDANMELKKEKSDKPKRERFFGSRPPVSERFKSHKKK